MELTEMLDTARTALAEIDPSQLDPSSRIAYATAVGQLCNASLARHTAELLEAWFQTEAERTNHVARIADRIDPPT